MKKYLAYLCFLFAFAALAFGQTAAASSSTISASGLVSWLTPVLVPLVITGFKKLLPSIPGWVLPMIAPVLGVALDFVNSLLTTHSTNLVVAALLGLAGVGIREVVDQAKQVTKPTDAA